MIHVHGKRREPSPVCTQLHLYDLNCCSELQVQVIVARFMIWIQSDDGSQTHVAVAAVVGIHIHIHHRMTDTPLHPPS